MGASYSSPLNLQIPETPRLAARGNEAVYNEFQMVYNAIRYLVRGIGDGTGTSVSWGNITGSIANQLDLTAILNTKLSDAPSDGNIYGRKDGSWTTIASGGTVTSVGTGTGLTGGPITTTGTVSIANTTVVAGSYTNANITVNAQGQLTAASNGSGGTGGILPMVDGSIPPNLMYQEDGNLIYFEV